MTRRPLTVEGLANVRDLGGMIRRDGSVTPAGVFYRSENLDRVGPGGWDQLREYGVTTVIDLRRPDERSGAVPTDIAHVLVDLDGDERDFWTDVEADGRWATPLYYVDHLASLPHRMASVVTALAGAQSGGVLFHCAAGWDRTGLVAAILLRAARVQTEDATDDYLQSFANVPALESLHGRSFHADLRREATKRWRHTPETAFAEAFENLNVRRWFDVAGIDEPTRRAILTWRGALDPD